MLGFFAVTASSYLFGISSVPNPIYLTKEHFNANPTPHDPNDDDYCPYDINTDCSWNDNVGSPQCQSIDSDYGADDQCFGYFKFNFDPKGQQIHRFNFEFNGTGRGRLLFKIILKNYEYAFKYAHIMYGNSYLDMGDYDDINVYHDKPDYPVTIKVYFLPTNPTDTVKSVMVNPLTDSTVNEIPNYAEYERSDRLPTARLEEFTTQGGVTVKRATLKLYKENPTIMNLCTKFITDPYTNTQILKQFTSPLGGSPEQEFVMPIIAGRDMIIGIDIMANNLIHDWKYCYNQGLSNVAFLTMNVKPIDDFEISYLILYAESNSYKEALEIWHKAFPEYYMINPYGKAAVAKYADTSKWTYSRLTTIRDKFGGKLVVDDVNKKNRPEGVLNFNEIDPTIIKTNATLNIENFDTECPDTVKECELVKKYGIKDQNGNRIITKVDDHLECTVMISDEIIENMMIKYNKKKSKTTYNGVYIKNFDTRYANYKVDDAIQYTKYLCIDSNGKEYYNAQNGMLKLLKYLHGDSPKGFVVESYLVRPQLAQYVGSALIQVESKTNFVSYSNYYKLGILGTRYSLGSKVMSMMDTTGTFDEKLSWQSWAVVAGALPTGIKLFDYDNIWNNVAALQLYFGDFYANLQDYYDDMITNGVFLANYRKYIYTDSFKLMSVYCTSNTCYLGVIHSFYNGASGNINSAVDMKQPQELNCNLNSNYLACNSYQTYPRPMIVKIDATYTKPTITTSDPPTPLPLPPDVGGDDEEETDSGSGGSGSDSGSTLSGSDDDDKEGTGSGSGGSGSGGSGSGTGGETGGSGNNTTNQGNTTDTGNQGGAQIGDDGFDKPGSMLPIIIGILAAILIIIIIVAIIIVITVRDRNKTKDKSKAKKAKEPLNEDQPQFHDNVEEA